MRTPGDQAIRERALDPAQSFIVQAPAGSGKTGLLVQRYLALLPTVNEPEEIIAITFTRKAAGEMRQRLIEALAGSRDSCPDDPYSAKTWKLARDAMAHSDSRNWQIEAQPTRLRIQTIDSLCHWIVRRMPWVSGMGGMPLISEQANALYREAARRTLTLIDEPDSWAEDIGTLLTHLDNDLPRTIGLLVNMLSRRDHWLGYLAGQDPDALRPLLEDNLAHAIVDSLNDVRKAVPEVLAADIVWLVNLAASNCTSADSMLMTCNGIKQLPDTTPAALSKWQAIANLLLTQKGEFRKQLTRKQGIYSAKSNEHKEITQRAKQLLAALSDQNQLREYLAGLRLIPQPEYTESQWSTLRALIKMLPLASAQLRVLFAERGTVDFIELALGASSALGQSDSPTDLMLSMDYQFRHILVDEFQDTSRLQYSLLEHLTAGWTADEGRSLFLVGDPMQSIYRFREADVGLFLAARRDGIGCINLTPLNLEVNFRSTTGIVEWINRCFSEAMPNDNDIARGAVCFEPSKAHHAGPVDEAVSIHPLINADAISEAERVIVIIKQVLIEDADQTIAILARSRSHLHALLPALRKADVQYNAVDLEPLATRPVVLDLLSLTRALLHPADRTAWLSVLRSPCCGLTLKELHTLTAGAPQTCVPDLLRDTSRRLEIKKTNTRIEHVASLLLERMTAITAKSLRRHVEGTWLALGGPAFQDETALANADAFFLELDGLEHGDDDTDLIARLEERLQRLYAQPEKPAHGHVLVLTIHKAKGLEFDTVIIPGLGRSTRRDTAPVLAWSRRITAHGREEMLIAPIGSNARSDDPVFQYIRQLEGVKDQFEATRLLYVAITRARRKLHLLGNVKTLKSGDLAKPVSGSLLGHLWPFVRQNFEEALDKQSNTPVIADHAPASQGIYRLHAEWTCPRPPVSIPCPLAPRVSELESVEYQWVGTTARHVGTIVHRYLHRIANDGIENWSVEQVHRYNRNIRRALASLGVAYEDMDDACARVITALCQLLLDDRGRWMLSAHQEAHSEYALGGYIDGRIVHVVLDRTFVDEAGKRWIIDFKTSSHEGSNLEEFLDSEQSRYQGQLERYAGLVKHLDGRPVYLGLYFPLMCGWRAWQAK